MKGRRVSYIPGWDCHGLPIELKVLEDNEQLSFYKSPMMIRKKAREYVLETIKHQKESFKSFGIMADWEKSYHTLDVSYIIQQLDIFKKMVEKDLIYRRYKPVYWSPSSKTALADAELIYKNDHISQAIFVRFPLINLGKLSAIINIKNKKPLYVLIWTTTPWTLPANKAILIDKDMEYTIVNTTQYGNLIVSRNRVPHLLKFINISETSLHFFGEALLGATYYNPLEENFKEMPFFHTKYITSDSGTGLVHAAPGHGMEDYEVCIQHNIPIFSPVDDHGCFTKEALNGKLEFLFVLEHGNKKVIELLENQKMLVSLEKYIHKYPYDWRTKKPVIQRATAQWFVDIEKIKYQTIKALKNVKMIPENGRERLISFLRSRSEWCISRQRAWGVPIPVLYSLENEKPLLTVKNINHIINMVKKYGMDTWWQDSESDIWVAPEYKKDGIRYKKGMETMDVWFDSGVSWNVIFNNRDYDNLNSEKDKPLIDLVLEGSDQHRGWFQSLLLTFVASQNDHSNIAPYGTVITHGHVLDQYNQKMSKSIGNVINPENIIFGEKDIKKGPAYGVDVLRLWAVGNNFTNDINISSLVLKNVAEIQRKFRATLRFLLGNLHDWNGDKVEYKDLKKIDQYALAQTYEFNRKTIELYDKFLFFQVVHAITNYTNNQLSSFYFDIIKDRLYADHRTSKSRTSCQTVLFHIFRNYISIISPIAPSLALEAWKFSRKEIIGEIETPFHSGWYKCEEEWLNLELQKEFQNIKTIRSASNLILEKARKNKYIRSSLECEIIIKAPLKTQAFNFLKKIEHELSQILIVSDISVISMDSELLNQKWDDYQEITLFGSTCHLIAKLSEKKKCLRCWMYTATMNADICHRCKEVMLNN
ncbi:isoleucine-tRNA ligase [Pneumocystis murina B123]|uniref:isoleucine--tRNA ligase n=1 Tax=Pneumocystis murina (strain B123) TaxID=1069680 RepID=M7P426_PNEMU|nr:isoleucine-tRNA ligase [Pneumocystis murina B123]EMR08620.1 isoleucine-tRNA ligase [Pneumocystis murina B123]